MVILLKKSPGKLKLVSLYILLLTLITNLNILQAKQLAKVEVAMTTS